MMRMIAAIVLGFLCASPAWATNLKRFMLIGDSIQSGIGVTNAAALAANLLADGANVVVHNFSSPGARMTDGGPFPGFTHDGLCVQQVYGTSSFPLNGIIITLGTNDWTG